MNKYPHSSSPSHHQQVILSKNPPTSNGHSRPTKIAALSRVHHGHFPRILPLLSKWFYSILSGIRKVGKLDNNDTSIASSHRQSLLLGLQVLLTLVLLGLFIPVVVVLGQASCMQPAKHCVSSVDAHYEHPFFSSSFSSCNHVLTKLERILKKENKLVTATLTNY